MYYLGNKYISKNKFFFGMQKYKLYITMTPNSIHDSLDSLQHGFLEGV